MKEPGQIAHRAFYTALHMTDVQIDNNWRRSETHEAWAAVEAACRAEGMREAARIAYECPDYVSRMDVDEFGVLPPGSPYDQGRHDAMKAILSAIGGQK